LKSEFVNHNFKLAL